MEHSAAAIECLEAVFVTFHCLPTFLDKQDAIVKQINAYLKRIQDFITSKPALPISTKFPNLWLKKI